MSTEKIEDKFVRVDVPKTTRSLKKLPKEKFLEHMPLKPMAIMRGKNWRTEMGKLGVMLKSDYDKGEFASYGLDEERILGNLKSDQLEKENVDLQKKVAELQAKLSENGIKTEEKHEEEITENTPPAPENETEEEKANTENTSHVSEEENKTI